MHRGLSSFLGSVLNWHQPTPRKSRPIPRGRKLLGEQLEARYALAGDLVEPIGPLLADGQLNVSTVELSPPADPLVGFIEPPGTINMAPVIAVFTFSYEGNWLTLRGFVTDDQDPSGYLVEFSGIISGSVAVGADDWFSYRFEFAPEYSGSIGAQTHDMLGLASNIAYITL
jgi:hypothetical protein